MKQSSSCLHVAIIMDGNGRWAEARGLPRAAGHAKGAAAVRRTVEAAPPLGIRTLTLYAFSSDNWKRPSAEVSGLMRLLAGHLQSETPRCLRNGVRLSMIGRRDRLPAPVIAAAEQAEALTAGQTRLHLRLAIDYSARAAIQSGMVGDDVDLLIRTGGEQRLSDFLLWECAYAELHFTTTMWPDFNATHLRLAIEDFHSRDRRFGSVSLPQLWTHDEQGSVPEFRGDRWLR